jgi:hypothetical protein
MFLNIQRAKFDNTAELIKAGANANILNYSDETPLHIAARQEQVDVEDVIKGTFDSFVVFKPTETDLAQGRLFESKCRLWSQLLSLADIWKFVRVGMKCFMDDGKIGVIKEVSSNGAYKALVGDDIVSSGIVEIDMKLDMKIKNFDSALILSKLKKIGQVARPVKYDDIMEYIQSAYTNRGLLDDYQGYKKWLESENLCRKTLLTPLGEIAACIGSICPALGSKLLSDDIQDEDIVAAVATFSAARDNSSSEKSFKIPFADYYPFSLDYDLVAGVKMVRRGVNRRHLQGRKHVRGNYYIMRNSDQERYRRAHHRKRIE